MTFLSPNQLKQYKDEGFVSPIDIFSKEKAKDIRNEIELIEKKMPNELEKSGRYNAHLISPLLDDVTHNSKVLDTVESLIGKNILANFGELNPILLKSLDIGHSVVAFEIFTDTLAQFLAKKTSTISAFDNNPYQMVERDFAFLFPKSVKANDIINKIKKIDKKVIEKVSIFDVYEGEKIESDSKSIAIRVLLQPIEKTFSDEEIENLSNQIIDTVITSFAASLRK